MKKFGVDAFVEKWTKDGSFRDSYRKDPKSALMSAGIKLDQAEIDAIRSIGIAIDSGKLDSRINRDPPTNTGC